MSEKQTNKDRLRHHINDARNSDGTPPLVGFLGFGTWAQLAGECPPDEPRRRAFVEIESDGYTMFVADPNLEEGVVVFPVFDAPHEAPKFVVRNGLSYLDI